MQEAALVTLPLFLLKRPSYHRLIKGPEKYDSGVSSSGAFMCLCIINRACEAEGLDHHCGEYSAEGPVAVTKVTFKWVLIHCCDVHWFLRCFSFPLFTHVSQCPSLINININCCKLNWIQC